MNEIEPKDENIQPTQEGSTTTQQDKPQESNNTDKENNEHAGIEKTHEDVNPNHDRQKSEPQTQPEDEERSSSSDDEEEKKEDDKSSEPENERDSGADYSEQVKPSIIAPNVNVYKVFVDAILQRKKSSFGMFQNWEQLRADKIDTYRSICENLLQKIQLRTSLSINGTEGLLKFFNDRKIQEEHYYTAATKNLTPLGPLFSDKTLGDWGLPKIFREYDEYHLRQTKSSQQLALFIQNTLIKDVLAVHKDSMKRLTSFKQKIADMRKKLKVVNKRIEKKGSKYSNLVHHLLSMETTSKKDSQKDLYAKELSLIAVAQKHTEAYQGFGALISEFWDAAEAIENARFNSIKFSLRAYTEKCSEFYGDSFGRPEVLNKLLASFEVVNEVKHLFSPSLLLSPDEIDYIKQEIGLEGAQQLTKEHAISFLEKIPFEPPKTKPLVLKEWEAQRETGTFKSLKPCLVVVSIDGNLLLIDRSDERVNKKADAVIKFSQITLKEDSGKKNPLMLEFLVVKPGLLVNSKKKYVLKFNKTDHVDELLHYLSNYNQS